MKVFYPSPNPTPPPHYNSPITIKLLESYLLNSLSLICSYTCCNPVLNLTTQLNLSIRRMLRPSLYTAKSNEHFSVFTLFDFSTSSNIDNQSFCLVMSSLDFSFPSSQHHTDFSASTGPYISISPEICPSHFSLYVFSLSNLTYSYGFEHHFTNLYLNPDLTPKFQSHNVNGLKCIYRHFKFNLLKTEFIIFPPNLLLFTCSLS